MTTPLLTSIANPAFHDLMNSLYSLSTTSGSVGGAQLDYALDIHRTLKNKGTDQKGFSFFSDNPFKHVTEILQELSGSVYEHNGRSVELPASVTGYLLGDERVIYYTDDEIVMIASAWRNTDQADRVTVRLRGDVTLVNEVFEILASKYRVEAPQVYNVSLTRSGLIRRRMPITAAMSQITVPASNYPYLKETPGELSEMFLASEQNVIVMIGPPGTGKSTYTREMIFSIYRTYRARVELDENALMPVVLLLSDAKVLAHEELLDFLQIAQRGDRDVIFVFEDADNLIGRRSDGNSVMSGLLNMSDGIVKSKTKIIISTNLSGVDKVDEALIRPGRCFGIVTFSRLSLVEANVVRKHYGKELLEGKNTWTLAEAINYVPDRHNVTPTFGFRA